MYCAKYPFICLATVVCSAKARTNGASEVNGQQRRSLQWKRRSTDRSARTAKKQLRNGVEETETEIRAATEDDEVEGGEGRKRIEEQEEERKHIRSTLQ